jgi:hypothetical protein
VSSLTLWIVCTNNGNPKILDYDGGKKMKMYLLVEGAHLDEWLVPSPSDLECLSGTFYSSLAEAVGNSSEGDAIVTLDILGIHLMVSEVKPVSVYAEKKAVTKTKKTKGAK